MLKLTMSIYTIKLPQRFLKTYFLTVGAVPLRPPVELPMHAGTTFQSIIDLHKRSKDNKAREK